MDKPEKEREKVRRCRERDVQSWIKERDRGKERVRRCRERTTDVYSDIAR